MNLFRSFALFAATLAASSAETTTPPPEETTTTVPPLCPSDRELLAYEERDLSSSRGPVVGRVKMSGNEASACERLGLKPGCLGSFVLSARKYADGSVDGQLHTGLTCRNSIHSEVKAIIFCGDYVPGGPAIVCTEGTVVRDKTDTERYLAVLAYDGGKDGDDFFNEFVRPSDWALAAAVASWIQ